MDGAVESLAKLGVAEHRVKADAPTLSDECVGCGKSHLNPAASAFVGCHQDSVVAVWVWR